jgi:hypothetical protein
MKAPPPETFRSGRDFAAWLGLTPKDDSTGGGKDMAVSQKPEIQLSLSQIKSGYIDDAVRPGSYGR